MQMLASITYVLFCRVVCTLRCYGFEIHIPCAFDCRVLSLDSLGERRGLVLNILDLKKLLGGCSQLEVGHSICLLAMELIISIVYLFIYFLLRLWNQSGHLYFLLRNTPCPQMFDLIF
jgi:hypothetical protein